MFSRPTLKDFAEAMVRLWPDEEFAEHFRRAFKLKETPRWINQSIAANPTEEMQAGTYLLYDAHYDVIEIALRGQKIHIRNAITGRPEVRELSG